MGGKKTWFLCVLILFGVLTLISVWLWPAHYPYPNAWLGIDFIVMGVLGVIVSEFSFNKIAVIFVFVALAIVGIRLTIQTSNDADKAQRQLRKKIAEIEGQITGGDSYLYFEPGEPMILPNGAMLSNAFPQFVGEEPLHEAYISTFGPMGHVGDLNYGTVFPHEIGRPREFLALQFRADGGLQIFYIFINASNGAYSEVIRFQKSDGRWRRALRVAKYQAKGGRVLRTYVEPGFPTDIKGQVDWSKP